MSELEAYKGRKGRGAKKALPLNGEEIAAATGLVIEASTLHHGRPAEYPNTNAGLDCFVQKTIDYFQYVHDVNAGAEEGEIKLLPDIEGWAVYLGLTRQTLWTYSKRSGEWGATIEFYKDGIATVKKQMAMRGKVPPIFAIFDMVNNHGYQNTKDVKITHEAATSPATLEDDIEQKIADAGLIWNPEKGEFEAED